MIKAHFSGRTVSSGISDVVFASVYSEKTEEVDENDEDYSPHASEQANAIGSVSVHIYIYIYIYIYICHQKKFVIERSRDLIYLKFVATDFSPKIISPSAGENSGSLA